jgi:4-azaleucine resistance transporter AzlC
MPFMLGLIPFGLVTGISAVQAGFSPLQILFMSMWVYAGAAQLVAVQLMASGGTMFLVVLASIVVNLRYLMYSSAIAEPLSSITGFKKAVAAFFLVDQNFALTLQQGPQLGKVMTGWFYFGTALPFWVNWQICTWIGAVVGARVPAVWQLDYSVPLCFLVLTIPAVKDRPTLVAALTGGLVAAALHALPYRLGLFIGAILGIIAGIIAENRGKNVAS